MTKRKSPLHADLLNRAKALAQNELDVNEQNVRTRLLDSITSSDLNIEPDEGLIKKKYLEYSYPLDATISIVVSMYSQPAIHFHCPRCTRTVARNPDISIKGLTYIYKQFLQHNSQLCYPTPEPTPIEQALDAFIAQHIADNSE